MASHLVKGPVCGVENCRSKRYEEGEDGFLYCQNGHRQAGLVRGQDDEDNFSSAARTVTRKKKVEDESSKKTAKHLSGRQAVDLYLKCLQLILRHQIWSLIHEKGLPAELETVIFDLWALRVAQLSDKISTEGQEASLEAQVFSTIDSDQDEATDADPGKNRAPRKRYQKLRTVPNLKDCLVLCYLGATTLRLPVTPGDLFAWMYDGKLPYTRAIRLIPMPMRDRLPAPYHDVLDPSALLTYEKFYVTLNDLRSSYGKDHGISWPALNVPLLLFRYLKYLALPLELYDATMRLSHLLEYDFAFHNTDRVRSSVQHLPEAQLMAALVLSTKLLYPFDSIKRHPQSSSEPTALTMNWNTWPNHLNAAKVAQRDGYERLTNEQMLRMTEERVFDMLPAQMDQWMGFYEKELLDGEVVKRAREGGGWRDALCDMFPIDGPGDDEPRTTEAGASASSRNDALDAVRAVHRDMKPMPAVRSDAAGKEVLRPGQRYSLWKKECDVPDLARPFWDESARQAGLSTKMLTTAVFVAEMKLVKWQKRKRENVEKEVVLE